jgi:hypothetical protein
MAILKEQILMSLEEGLMSCLQACPASRRVWPGSAEARAMSAGSGRQCSMLFDASSPLGAFSKILLQSSHWTNSEEYCYVWERLDTQFGVSAFQLTPLGPGTSGTESSLLGTPVQSQCGPNGMEGNLKQTLMKLWPTPCNRDYRSGSGKTQAERGRTAGMSLPETFQGSLNPRFVEELMGFPVDHTALSPSATQSFRSRPTRSLRRSDKP